VPVISEEPDIEPHTVELPEGLSVSIGPDVCTIQQDKNGSFYDVGESSRLGDIIGFVKDQLDELKAG